jgi:hypothetical protein
MLEIKFVKPLEFKLSLSTAHRGYALGIHLLALCVTCLPFVMSMQWRAMIACLVVLSYFYQRTLLARRYQGILSLLDEHTWQWINSGDQQQLYYQSGSILAASIIILNFRDERGKRVSWCVLPGQLDDELRRKLRIYVRSFIAGTVSGTT